uniref:Reverse transcriptase zinc-binding domain-containing protein n=1 Tax=Manihot esculenta TaxID=3983 RepID=A0A2C9W292_MANES
MNKALLEKLAWRAMENNDCLWTKCFTQKYLQGRSQWTSNAAASSSHVWKVFCKGYGSIKDGLMVDVRNGSSINFLFDSWLSIGPLAQFALIPVAYLIATINVRQFWSPLTGWNWDVLKDLLSNNILVSMFLWQIGHKKIMTNMERIRRGFASQGICPICNLGQEDIFHLLRDCRDVKDFWISVDASSFYLHFFTIVDSTEWIFTNLKSNYTQMDGQQWNIIFPLGLWYLWKKRNKVTLENTEAWKRASGVGHTISRSSTTFFLAKGCQGPAGCAGVFRDSNGDWLLGYQSALGTCTTIEAEFWGILLVLQTTNIFDESNSVTDYLAKSSVGSPLGMQILEMSYVEAHYYLQVDVVGAIWPQRFTI